MQLQKAGLGLGKCTTILITHLHGDHYFGLPGLLSSLALTGRAEPIIIHGPPHLRPRINALFEWGRYPMPYEVHFEEVIATELQPLTAVKDLRISTFPLQHRTPTNGYLITEAERPANLIKAKIREYDIPWQQLAAIKKGADFVKSDGTTIPNGELVTPAPPPRSFAYCSDTRYFPKLADYVKGVDLLYHEATFLSDLQEDAVRKGHATAAEAARVARDGRVDTLVMGHFSSRYPDVSAHEREARAIFPNSFAARDLHRYSVPFRGRQGQS